MAAIIEFPVAVDQNMDGWIMTSPEQLFQSQVQLLPRQTIRCPAGLPDPPFSPFTKLTMDAYLQAAWSPQANHYMANVILLVKQCETSVRRVQNGGNKAITNILAAGSGITELQVSGWEPYTSLLSSLQAGKVSSFKKYRLETILIF